MLTLEETFDQLDEALTILEEIVRQDAQSSPPIRGAIPKTITADPHARNATPAAAARIEPIRWHTPSNPQQQEKNTKDQEQKKHRFLSNDKSSKSKLKPHHS